MPTRLTSGPGVARQHPRFARNHWIVVRNHWILPRNYRMLLQNHWMLPRNRWIFIRNHQIFIRNHWMLLRNHWMLLRNHWMFAWHQIGLALGRFGDGCTSSQVPPFGGDARYQASCCFAAQLPPNGGTTNAPVHPNQNRSTPYPEPIERLLSEAAAYFRAVFFGFLLDTGLVERQQTAFAHDEFAFDNNAAHIVGFG